MGKKLQKNFRLDPGLAAELNSRSGRSGIDETMIVEDALRLYLGSSDQDTLDRRAHVLREPAPPYTVNSKPATQGKTAEKKRQAETRKPKGVQ